MGATGMVNESKLLIGALGAAVAGKECSVITDVDYDAFLHLAQSHGVEALAFDGLQKNSALWQTVPESVQESLKKAYFRAAYREAQQTHTQQQLRQGLTKAGVRHIFLKGAVLRKSYPVPMLRTMSDMDVLVYTEDYDKIAAVAQSIKGKAYTGDGNHKNFVFPGDVAVEFHPNLLHHATPVGTGINPGWQYAKKDLPGPEMELTEEGLYLNILCHLANHFVSGGVGVRFVLDIWVCRHLRKEVCDYSYVDRELADMGMLDFARNIEALADAWFSDGEMTPLLEELGNYILTSGSHGTSDRAMLNAVSLSSGGNRTSALLRRIFYPRQELEDRFPWCKGKPWLLPAAWLSRVYDTVTKRSHLILKWAKGTGQYSSNEINNQREMLNRFGIYPDK